MAIRKSRRTVILLFDKLCIRVKVGRDSIVIFHRYQECEE